MPYYGDALPYYYGGPFSNHSSLMTGTGRSLHSPLGSSRYAPHLSTISESPLSALRRYSPAASTMSSRPKRVIDTADIDVSTPRALSHPENSHNRNRLRRDRPTIRIRSQALKDNPALREHYERHEKTVGELLVEKFLIKDKKPEGPADGAETATTTTRPRLYSQVSLERADGSDAAQLQEALQKRVTRRMTRRRSSADVQMDPEQLEREVLIALAQADALDTLVAQEQAEIEVETRMGTLIRKNLVRATPSVLGKHEKSGEEDEEATRTRKLAKKVKKRRKTTDKPSPPSESEEDARKPGEEVRAAGSEENDAGKLGKEVRAAGSEENEVKKPGKEVRAAGSEENEARKPGNEINAAGKLRNEVRAAGSEEKDARKPGNEVNTAGKPRNEVRTAGSEEKDAKKMGNEVNTAGKPRNEVRTLGIAENDAKKPRNEVRVAGSVEKDARKPGNEVNTAGKPRNEVRVADKDENDAKKPRNEVRAAGIVEKDTKKPGNEVRAAGKTRNEVRTTDFDENDARKPKNKVEASNSVGDFSTLWINAGAAEQQEKQRKASQQVVEQFRDSVRLPAPRAAATRLGKIDRREPIVEEHQQVVVLPVRRRYVKDDSRNSVYLTLKTPKNSGGAAERAVGNAEVEFTDQADSADDARRLTGLLNGGSEPRGPKVAKFRSKDNAESGVEVRSVYEASKRVEGPGERWTKDAAAIDEPSIWGGSDETPKKSISLAGRRDEASGILDEREEKDVISTIVRSEEDSRDLANFCGGAESEKISGGDRARDEGRDEETLVRKKDDVKILAGGRKEKDLGKGNIIGEQTKRIKRSVSALDSPSAKVEARFERSVSDGQAKSEEREEDKIASVSSVVSPRSVVESLPNASTINALDARAVKSREGSSREFTGNSEARAEDSTRFAKISGKNGEAETLIAVTKAEAEVDGPAKLRKAIESPKTPRAKRNGNFFKFEEDDEVDGKDVADASKVRNKRNALGKLSSLAGDEGEAVRPESPDLKVVPDSPKKSGLFLKKRAIATTNGEKSPLVSPVEKADLLGDAKKKLKREKDAENLVEEKIAESPKTNGEKSPLLPPVEKADSSVDAKKKLKEKIGENLVEEKVGESPKTNGEKSPLLSPVEKADLLVDAKKKLKREKDADKIVENSIDKKILESPKTNGEKSPLLSPVEKADPSIDAKKKLNREKDTKKIVENSAEKKIPELPKANGEKIPSLSPVEKADLSIDTKKKLKPEKDVENSADKKIPESPSKLTNGASKLKLKPIEEIRENRELAKAEKPKLKIWNKPDTPPIQEDDGIDFWGEIASQRISKPASKPKTETLETKEDEKPAIVAPKPATNSEPEVKPNPPAEISSPIARKEASPSTSEEKKPGKIKKKKTTESGACKKKDQEKAAAETILERVISVEGGDEKSPQQQQPSEKSLENEASEEKSCGSHEADRFERNLSTIAEETSPVTEELPKIKDLASLILSSQEKSAESKLEPSIDLVSQKLLKTASSVASSLVDPEATTAVGSPETGEKIAATATEKSAIEPEKAAKPSLPTITIVEAPGTPPDQEESEEPLEEVQEEEEPEGPGTPTNEAADETPKNITKWNGRSDLSLDEPDKEITAEATVAAKKESSKKKTSTKKKVSKKGSKGSAAGTPGGSPDSSKNKKLGKRKKTPSKTGKESEKRSIFEERESKISNSSDTTLKPGGLNLRNSPKNSPRNTPKQRPLDLIKMFYTTPASLLTATPRDLSKVRRAKIKKRKHSSRTASASSDSTGSTRSTQSTGTAESTGSTEHEDDAEQKRISSTRSNDSGFDGSPRLSTPSQSSDNQRNSDGSDHHHASGRITPPATNLPRFKKYTVMDFNFLKVLGKGSFGKVLLAELRRTDCVYAVKCLKKDVVLEDDDVECTLIERKVLTLATRHPYLCHLFCTFQTDSHLFFVMEYLNGGDLMFHIQKSGRFAESRARFYAAEIWSGLNFLHKKGIVYRDLKLDNVLLDFEGHIRIADFGMCKLQIFLDRTADTFCGTPDYMAPEIIKGLKYNQAVDWWSFGVLLYEMLTGQSPFSGCDEDELFWSICNERPFIPRYLSQEAMDVLVCLLEKDAGKRPLAHDISVHPFFHSTQWDRLERRQLEPPFKPALEHTLDTRYFDTAFTAERPRLTPVPEQILTSMDQGVFRGFSYTNPNATD